MIIWHVYWVFLLIYLCLPKLLQIVSKRSFQLKAMIRPRQRSIAASCDLLYIAKYTNSVYLELLIHIQLVMFSLPPVQ